MVQCSEVCVSGVDVNVYHVVCVGYYIKLGRVVWGCIYILCVLHGLGVHVVSHAISFSSCKHVCVKGILGFCGSIDNTLQWDFGCPGHCP